jgi:hypothetical protein
MHVFKEPAADGYFHHIFVSILTSYCKKIIGKWETFSPTQFILPETVKLLFGQIFGAFSTLVNYIFLLTTTLSTSNTNLASHTVTCPARPPSPNPIDDFSCVLFYQCIFCN